MDDGTFPLIASQLHALVVHLLLIVCLNVDQFAIGVLYMLMGVCCLQGLRDKLKANEKEEWKKYREAMKNWKKERRGEV